MGLNNIGGLLERETSLVEVHEVVGTYIFHFKEHRSLKIEVVKVLHGPAAEFFGLPYVEADIVVTGKSGDATVRTWVSVLHHEAHGQDVDEVIANTFSMLSLNLKRSNLSELG
ncbi:MAG: hypothetical protein JST12_08870 [Armatimonadetes bacterium]|nr:hypothetical protein [Armatimonadota bacterium]